MPDHPYDNQKLMPREWMLAVMHDKSVSLITRMNVAVQLLKMDYESGNLFIERPHWPGEPRFTIVIQGLGNELPEVSVQVDEDHGDADHGSKLVGHA